MLQKMNQTKLICSSLPNIPWQDRPAEGPVYRKWSGRRALQQSEGFAVE